MFLGLTARVLFPGIEARDEVLPTLLLHGLPVWLGALALAAVFSAEVGACEAILFMLSTSLSQDLYKRIDQSSGDARTGAARSRASRRSQAASRACCSPSSLSARSSTALSVFYSIIGATLLVPVVGGLFVREARTRDALASIAAGMIVFLAIRFGTDRAGWSNPNLWGLVASATGFYVSLLISRLGRRQPPVA